MGDPLGSPRVAPIFSCFIFSKFFGRGKSARVCIIGRSVFFRGGYRTVCSFAPEGGGGDCSEESRPGAYLISVWVSISISISISVGFIIFVLVFDFSGRVDFAGGKAAERAGSRDGRSPLMHYK